MRKVEIFHRLRMSWFKYFKIVFVFVVIVYCGMSVPVVYVMC